MLDLAQGQAVNAAAFVYYNHIVNENGEPITFKRHKFLIDFYLDNSPEIVAEKCSQVGFSTTAIIKSFHLSKFKKANIIYLLPSKSIVKDFVLPKVDPLIQSNTALKEMMGGTDNLGLKSVGEGKDQRFVYFRSSWDESSGIAISAHVLIADEYDRSNVKAVNTYKTRLDAALLDRPDLGWDWRFSNPTIDGRGVDELYQRSDQKKWMVKCSRCNHHQVLSWPENINMKDECYICVKCTRPLVDEDRIRGQWVKTFLGRDISGYRISQLMAPWVPVKKIIKDSLGDQSIFYNFTLGLPYTSKDIVVTRDAITRCLYPTANPRTNVAIGVDNGIVKHYVCMNKYGVFKVGSTEDWLEIESLRNQYDAYMVIDSNPYPTPVMKLVEKYPGKVFAHFYDEDTKENEAIRWGEGDKRGIVRSDRTKIIDAVVADINTQDLLFNVSLTELENQEYIKHWLNMYRVVEESAKGITRGVWKNIEGKPDHLAHAQIYAKVAMQQTLSIGMIAHTQQPNAERKEQAVYANPDGTIMSGFDFNQLKASLDRPRKRGTLR
jgi:hypothetical protein